MKANTKNSFRMFFKQKSRLISLIVIVLISVAFVSGLLTTVTVLKKSINKFIRDNNVSDIIIKSKSEYGFLNEDIEKINEIENVDISTSTTLDYLYNDEYIRLTYSNFSNVNNMILTEGKLPENMSEVTVSPDTKLFNGYNVGDIIEIYNPLLGMNQSLEVVGIGYSPLHFGTVKEPVQLENIDNNVKAILYLDNSSMPYINEINISIPNDYVVLSNKYNDLIDEYIKKINLTNVEILTLESNYSVASFVGYADKIKDISIIFVVFFMLVTALVVLSTMTRLLEEERSQIACQISLGCSKFNVIIKYVIFAMISTLIGSILGYLVGKLLIKALYVAFDSNYIMPYMVWDFGIIYFLITFGLIFLSVIFVTIYTGLKMMNNKPAELLLPKAPKSGKKVLIERIPFIWNKLSFKYKSSLRNVFRYKKHFFMTVISICGSTVLVLAGLGVLNVSSADENVDSLVTLAMSLVIFAGMLTALVIYNLTNISISERNREIATLMVLGYTNSETSFYIFREILFMSIIGGLLGLPVGALLLVYIFEFIGFGGIEMVKWYSYVISFVLTIVFSLIVCMMLYKKVVKIDMNESLKARE